VTENSTSHTLQVKGQNRNNKQPVEIFLFVFQYFTDLPTGLCTEILPKKVVHRWLCVKPLELCVKPGKLQWIKPAFPLPDDYPQSIPCPSTALTPLYKQLCGPIKRLTRSNFICISTEIALTNNSSSNPLKN
jgi:hypothetical protein